MEQTQRDATALLVDLCVKVLKDAAPRGLTTKDMAAALDNEITDGFNGISSSILSSKLNAVFRRCRNISKDPNAEDLEEIPMARAQSTEIPKRLVYKYSPKADDAAGTADGLEDAGVSHGRKRSASEASSLSEESNDEENVPLTPKEEDVHWPAAKKMRTGDAPAQAAAEKAPSPSEAAHEISRSNTPPTERKEQQRKKVEKAAKFNLYYDAVGFEALTAALEFNDLSNCKLAVCDVSDPEQWVEYVSPESFGLNDLDQLIS